MKESSVSNVSSTDTNGKPAGVSCKTKNEETKGMGSKEHSQVKGPTGNTVEDHRLRQLRQEAWLMRNRDDGGLTWEERGLPELFPLQEAE